ncbi:MAG: hypothetical protein M1830_007496 [Pleopsidium flavum]|nr:MAG: hypothetical protein M1830_007496 [Pleopsidium flavum]
MSAMTETVPVHTPSQGPHRQDTAGLASAYAIAVHSAHLLHQAPDPPPQRPRHLLHKPGPKLLHRPGPKLPLAPQPKTLDDDNRAGQRRLRHVSASNTFLSSPLTPRITPRPLHLQARLTRSPTPNQQVDHNPLRPNRRPLRLSPSVMDCCKDALHRCDACNAHVATVTKYGRVQVQYPPMVRSAYVHPQQQQRPKAETEQVRELDAVDNKIIGHEAGWHAAVGVGKEW